jgi:hypothetical protein
MPTRRFASSTPAIAPRQAADDALAAEPVAKRGARGGERRRELERVQELRADERAEARRPPERRSTFGDR